ncbi:MAG: prepilin-type N-terminal cleavage/methylation domain-containing protein [Candidatus Omnitrophota bacterium]
MKDPKGFTLTEIVVSAVVLALMASGVFSAMLSGKYLISRSKNRARALEITKYHMEDLRQHIRADRWNETSPYPLNPSGSWSGWATHSGTIFSWRYRVSPVANSDCRQVDVQTRWSEPRV